MATIDEHDDDCAYRRGFECDCGVEKDSKFDAPVVQEDKAIFETIASVIMNNPKIIGTDNIVTAASVMEVKNTKKDIMPRIFVVYAGNLFIVAKLFNNGNMSIEFLEQQKLQLLKN